jgi:hypothetical protein
MDVLQLRAAVEAILLTFTGTYTLANGATTPAVSVRAKGQPMMASTSVTGLEVIIQRDPETFDRVDQYRDMESVNTWVVWLAEWGTAAASATTAAALIVAALPGASAAPVALDTGGPVNMVRVEIQDQTTTVGLTNVFDGNGSDRIVDGNG